MDYLIPLIVVFLVSCHVLEIKLKLPHWKKKKKTPDKNIYFYNIWFARQTPDILQLCTNPQTSHGI